MYTKTRQTIIAGHTGSFLEIFRPNLHRITALTSLIAIGAQGGCYASKPPHDVRIRSGLDPLRDYIGIEEEIQSSTLRALRLDRLMRTRVPRRGEEAKNSARLPLRSIFRSHSSADTTTAALRPRRVIVCGPSASAWSMITALRCALALATAQVRVDLAMHCPQIIPIVIIVIWGHSSRHW